MDHHRLHYDIGAGNKVLTVQCKLFRSLVMGRDDLALHPSIGGTSKVPEKKKFLFADSGSVRFSNDAMAAY